MHRFGLSLSSRVALVFASALLSLLVCGCAPRLEVSVQVLTDLAPATDFDRVALERDGVEVVGRVVSASQRFDRPYVLAELTDVASGTNVRLTVVLQRGGGRVLSRTIETRIDASRVLLFVLSSACRSVTCPPASDPSATECDDGVCIAPSCQGAACSPDAGHDEADAAEADSGPPPDASSPMDAPPSLDGGIDAATVAELDAYLAPDAPSRDAFAALDAPRDAHVPDARDAFVPSDAWGPCAELAVGAVCRPAVGECDEPEVCAAGSAACPPDRYYGRTTTCRGVSRTNPCDVAESCSGRSPFCPSDARMVDGTACNLACGDEMCMGGFCTGGVSCNPATHECCSDRCLPAPCARM